MLGIIVVESVTHYGTPGQTHGLDNTTESLHGAVNWCGLKFFGWYLSKCGWKDGKTN